MLKLNLRNKLLLFSVILALIPLGITGKSLITITQDELKSSANDELRITALQLAKDIDDQYLNTWRAPLLLIRNAMDNEHLGPREKLSMLTGIKNLVDVISLQLAVEGVDKPPMVIRDEYAKKLKGLGLDPIETLKLSPGEVNSLLGGNDEAMGGRVYLKEADSWLVTIALPLRNEIAGRSATLVARVDLDRLKNRLIGHEFAKTGFITLVDNKGVDFFGAGMKDVSDREIVRSALEMLNSGSRVGVIFPYARPGGEAMLGAFAMPQYFDWAVILEKKEEDAYKAIAVMVRSLMIIIALGFVVAAAGALVFSGRMSRPILEIGRVAQNVGKGVFNVKVSDIRTGDEIAELGKRMNEMIDGLVERFELQKFVSSETVEAIKQTGGAGVKLGGERKTATVFFSDIRGFTSFSEKVEPEVVIQMLNTYLSAEAQVVKKHNGDIDKYVGDELVAVFKGPDMVMDAIMCAIEIQDVMQLLNVEHKDWPIDIGIGINTGDMVMGAMGHKDRMDYTILGDTVNLGARLCSKAKARQIIISEQSYQYIKDNPEFEVDKLEPISVKGKEKPIQIYEVRVPVRPWPAPEQLLKGRGGRIMDC